MDEATWAALAATLTVLGLVWAWSAFRRKGAAEGMRVMAFALLPAAAWMTGTLQTLTEIGQSITSWATSLVFNPFTWTGIGLAGLSVVLFVVSGFMRERQRGRTPARSRPDQLTTGSSRTPLATPGKKSAAPADDDMADIEAILRARGIE